ncbi:MAG TPA: hypothetical protein VMV51_15790 [Gemmatimonadaceae bacterium]|nr:hypothetical protein [Gemmatimonadaceae bacterium]
MLDRRRFVQWAAAAAVLPRRLLDIPGPALRTPETARPAGSPAEQTTRSPRYAPGRIPNEYSLLLPGEAEALATVPAVRGLRPDAVLAAGPTGAARWMKVGEENDGWRLVAVIGELDGAPTAVFEKHVSHRGAIVYVTERGEVARVPKGIGDLANIRPRPINATPAGRFERRASFPAQPDQPGNYILGADEDPCYENVAALGEELIGWTLVANEESGPARSLWLEADGTSRQFGSNPESLWAPDRTGRLFDPRRFLPSEYLYEYVPGYSKRTLLGGYLPAADIGVWNPKFKVGYEVMALLPPGVDATPVARVRALLPARHDDLIPAGDTNADQQLADSPWVDRYWNTTAEGFFLALHGVWTHWRRFFDQRMRVEIPDPWLLDAARAGIVLSRCSYRGLEPSYQIGEGAYTKIPERSHALFPVAHYEFVWAQQLWGLSAEAEPYVAHYLETYIEPDGNFTYNTQDQVEAPLNTGVFLENSARAYDYTRDLDALARRLPVLRRMIGFVVDRYRYSVRAFPAGDPRHGLIWGSPEADLGDPKDDRPESHPWLYQNAVWTWRGLYEHGRVLAIAAADARAAGRTSLARGLEQDGADAAALAAEMRGKIERSLRTVLDARNEAMKRAGITPFHAFDTKRAPDELTSYENHRFMMDWWTADWGDAELDAGHFRHRVLAGEQLLGMNTDGHYPRTSNFMEHGTLAGRIREDDYRPFLLALYGNLCYAMDSGSRYAPEDALLPGNYPGEGSPYAWSAVINSELQPAMALRWLLCWEEHDRPGATPTVHLQKAAPRHWFARGTRIAVERCPTRFGELAWVTEPAGSGWRVTLDVPERYAANVMVHVHRPDGRALSRANVGAVRGSAVLLGADELAGKRRVVVNVG